MPRRPPDDFVYYLDANLDGQELVAKLRQAGMRCEPHRDHFAPDAADEAWIPAVASRGWVIVTRDFAIQRRRTEREAWTAASAIVVMLRGEKLSAEDMAKMLLAAYAHGRLDNFIAKRTPPMIIYLKPDGQLHVHFGGERRGGRKKE
jgi:PIN like domain